jgi:hypothetical protein
MPGKGSNQELHHDEGGDHGDNDDHGNDVSIDASLHIHRSIFPAPLDVA